MTCFKNNTPFDIRKLKSDTRFRKWYGNFQKNVDKLVQITFSGAIENGFSFYSILIEVIFRQDKITLTRSILLRGRAVVVIPALLGASLESSSYLVVRQLRVNSGRVSLEFPSGGVNENLSLSENALRELYEETGVFAKADELIMLGEDFVVCESAFDETATWFLILLEKDRFRLGNYGESLESERTQLLLASWSTLCKIQTFHMLAARCLLADHWKSQRASEFDASSEQIF